MDRRTFLKTSAIVPAAVTVPAAARAGAARPQGLGVFVDQFLHRSEGRPIAMDTLDEFVRFGNFPLHPSQFAGFLEHPDPVSVIVIGAQNGSALRDVQDRILQDWQDGRLSWASASRTRCDPGDRTDIQVGYVERGLSVSGGPRLRTMRLLVALHTVNIWCNDQRLVVGRNYREVA